MLERLGNDEIWFLPLDSSVRLWWDQQHYSGRPEETGRWLRSNNERYLRWTCQQSLSVCQEYWLQSSFYQSHGLLWCSDTIPHGTICHQHRPIAICAEGKDTGGRNGHRQSERRVQPMWSLPVIILLSGFRLSLCWWSPPKENRTFVRLPVLCWPLSTCSVVMRSPGSSTKGQMALSFYAVSYVSNFTRY